MPLEMSASAFSSLEVADATTLHDSDLTATNTRHQPDRIKPSVLTGVTIEEATIRTTLPPASWSVIRLATSA
jgi:alpha-N-arabinofuranosidase